MVLGKLFKSILGGSSKVREPTEESSEPLEYKGFTIEAAPLNTDGRFRSAGYISGEFEGEIRRVQFIRADECGDLQAAIDHSISKARQIIDEQGGKLLQKKLL